MLPYRRFPLHRMLPSWWMASWFLLLWIFCASLFPEFEIQSSSGIQWPIHEGGLCTGGILELHTPPLKPALATAQFMQGLPYLSLNEADKARRWQAVSFTGNGISDFVSLDNTLQCLQCLDGGSGQEAGIRIRFGPQVSYACFMEVLSMLWAWGDHTYYWLDVRHNPTTIYVILRPPEPVLN